MRNKRGLNRPSWLHSPPRLLGVLVELEEVGRGGLEEVGRAVVAWRRGRYWGVGPVAEARTAGRRHQAAHWCSATPGFLVTSCRYRQDAGRPPDGVCRATLPSGD